MPGFRRTSLVTALAAVLCITASTAEAIKFEMLDADGGVVGEYAPLATDWVTAPGSASGDVSALNGGGYRIDLDPGSFGLSENGTQGSAIYGAGLVLPAAEYGYRVSFSANLRSWDSYNDGKAVAAFPNGSLGFWDLFSVNANSSGFYWNLVDTTGSGGDGETEAAAVSAAGLLTDSLVPNQPAGSVVKYVNSGSDTAALPGTTWAWGGRDYAAGYFESASTTDSIEFRNNGNVYVSFVLDTATVRDADTDYPSWGAFGSPGQLVDVPDGEAGLPPGYVPGNPLLPVDGEVSDGEFAFAPFEIVEGGPGMESFLYIDPVIAVGYQYTVTGGPSFIEVLLPALGDADGYLIQLEEDGDWVTVGHVNDGGTFGFSTGVHRFRVMGIDASLHLDPGNPIAFVTGLKFDGTGTVQLEMEAVTAAVPEPGTWALMLAGIGGIATVRCARRRRASRMPLSE